MNNICRNRCRPHLEKQRCTGQLRIPQIPAEERERNLDSEKKSDSHYKFQCNNEERRRKAEAKRKKLIQKLKLEYRIDVDELGPQVLENILLQEEILEKQKRTREKDKIQRRFHFINKLVQDEKYKCRDAKYLPPLQKKARKIRRSCSTEQHSTRTDESENLTLSPNPEVEGSEESDNEIDILAEDTKTIVTGESESDPANNCDPKQSQESLLPLELFASPKEARVLPSAELNETYLRCNPDCIVFEFQKLKPDKTYTQTYKISNVGLDDVHCRYAGIATENDRIPPIRVEMTDSALLRPGLSLVGKVKMISSVEMTESKGFLIYETRRKKNPNKKACFRIPFECLPVRSIVEVSPSVIRFPSVTWCTATGKQRLKHMRKTIKIRNTGGKDCSCRIVNLEYLEGSSVTSKTRVGEEGSVRLDLSIDSGNEENLGESNYLPGAYEEAMTITSELLDNVFRVFRFSRKYHIPLPAWSTVEIDLDFLPEYRGYHHRVAFIRFEGADNCTETCPRRYLYLQKKLEMTGEIKKVPLRVEPPTVDLKICMINGGLYEGTFRVCNESKSPFPVRFRVPGSMKRHCLVFPGDSIIQPRSYQTCSVRLFPRTSISNDAFRYYEEETKVLEFPVFIQPSGKNSCKWDRIKLCVFAVLTSRDLELRPPEINFGQVTTLETVRTEITLVNHSMCPQDFGFLHLPKGVRIEPNYGFGTILPEETIKLSLLYSPILNSTKELTEEGTYSFRVEVTSLAKLCGFPTPSEETPESESTNCVWGEEPFYDTAADETPREILSPQESQANEKGEEEGESLSDDEDESRVLRNKREKIREYIGRRTDLLPARARTDNARGGREEPAGEDEGSSAWNSSRDGTWTITCKAFVIKPFCELSSTVIRLPATPLSSMSITRFRIGASPPERCDCNFKGGAAEKNCDFFFEAFFEFHASSTLITIEPTTGHIIRGQSLPVAIIFRPEFSKSELIYQSRVLKAQSLSDEARPKDDSTTSVKPKNKTKMTKQVREASRNQKAELECQDVNLTNLEITERDLFAGEKALQRTIDPVHLEFKVTCIMKILPCQGVTERMEHHSLKLIAPVVNPSFVYLGNCQEISFGKIAVGGSARKVIQIQNTSLNGISPRISALNPHGPFTCTTGSKIVRVDPEHIWRQPVTFSPTAERGKETEFFEVRNGLTSVALVVNGEGILPKYAISPDFELCVLETSVDVITEVELLIENLCEAELRFEFVLDFIKGRRNEMDESALFENVENIRETNGNLKSDTTFKKPERKGNRMTKDGSKRIVFMNELIPEVASLLETEYVDIQNPPSELFTITGVDKRNGVLLNPFGKCQLKVRFSPVREIITNKEGESSPLAAAYAVRYKMMLFRKMLKNLTIIGTLQTNSEKV